MVMTEVGLGVHRLGSDYVNCYVVETEDTLVLVDAGLPGYWEQVRSYLAARGRAPSEIAAILLTHSHADHMGFLREAKAASGAGVFVHRLDAAPGKKRWPPPWPYVRPTSWPWAAHAFRAGLLRAPNPEDVIVFEDGDVLNIPGAPRVVHSPGHTRGSSGFHFKDPNVFFSGDVLVTFDPYSRARGPRVMVDGVNEDPRQTRESLRKLTSVDSPLLLPGHGDPWERGVTSAVEQASV